MKVEEDAKMVAKYCIKCELHGYYEEYNSGHKTYCLHRICPCKFCQDHDRMLVLLSKVRIRRLEARRKWWLSRWEAYLFCQAQIIMRKIWEEALFLQAKVIVEGIQAEMDRDFEIGDQFLFTSLNIKEELKDSDNSVVDFTVNHDAPNSTFFQESRSLFFLTPPRNEEDKLGLSCAKLSKA